MKQQKLRIRRETEADYAAAEHMTREAFWNVNVPGCNEHYYLHCMRSHRDYLPALCFVAAFLLLLLIWNYDMLQAVQDGCLPSSRRI